MKLPNGYGSVYKLKGNRRKPWVARITIDWKDNGQPVYAYLGYFETRQDALKCLADYNHQPYNLDKRNITLGELYDMWVRNKSQMYALNTRQNYESRRTLLQRHLSTPYRKFTRSVIQGIIDGQEYVTQKIGIRTFFVTMDKYAYELDIIQKPQAELLDPIQYDTISTKLVFTHDEIMALWDYGTIWSEYILIMLYSGIRISELFQIRGEDCFLGYFKCGVKTKAGKNRIIPIHSAIRDIVAKHMPEDMGYIISCSATKFRTEFNNVMSDLGMHHVPHETRHTFRTAFDNTDANRVCINLIMGHTSQDIGERVYTHKTIAELKEAIEKIRY